MILSLKLVLRAGLEPTTLCLEGRCSIQLSYRSTIADDRNLRDIPCLHKMEDRSLPPKTGRKRLPQRGGPESSAEDGKKTRGAGDIPNTMTSNRTATEKRGFVRDHVSGTSPSLIIYHIRLKNQTGLAYFIQKSGLAFSRAGDIVSYGYGFGIGVLKTEVTGALSSAYSPPPGAPFLFHPRPGDRGSSAPFSEHLRPDREQTGPLREGIISCPAHRSNSAANRSTGGTPKRRPPEPTARTSTRRRHTEAAAAH